MQASTISGTPSTRTLPLFFSFASMGVTSSSIPATIPSAAALAGSSSEDFLRAVPALFFGLLIGVLLSSALGSRCRPHSLTLSGSVIQAIGFAVLVLSVSSDHYVLTSAVIGIGFGLVEASNSVIARETAGQHTARLLSALTGTVAVAATITPLALATTVLGENPAYTYLVTALIHALVAATWAVNRRRPEDPSSVERQDRSRQGAERRGIRSTLVLVSIALALAAYVGVETVYSGWSAAIPEQAFSLRPEHSAIGTTVFWVLFAIGRYLTAWALGRGVAATMCLSLSGALIIVGLCLAAATVAIHPVAATAGIAIAVFGLGPCYSLILGIGLSLLSTNDAKTMTGLLVACGALGGSAIPAALLLLTDDATDPVMFAMTAVLSAGFGLLVLLASRLSRDSRERHKVTESINEED